MVGSLDKMLKALTLVLCIGGCLSSAVEPQGADLPRGCSSAALDQALEKLISNENIQLTNGVKFVKVNENLGAGEGGRSVKDSVLTRIKRFFTNYELQLKLSDMFQRKQDIIDNMQRALTSLNELQEGNEGKGHGGGFGGGKKGGGGILMMAAMMGGTMAALGFGALAMLVMKALTVSSMAFLLSAVLGLRRLLRRPDDDAGFGRISYIPVHAEHRKRRSVHDLPYRAHLRKT